MIYAEPGDGDHTGDDGLRMGAFSTHGAGIPPDMYIYINLHTHSYVCAHACTDGLQADINVIA